MEDVIGEKLVPTLTDRPPPSDVEHQLFSLPARLGGLAIPNPCDNSDGTYDASEKISNPLKQAILTHEFQYSYDHVSSQMSAKAEIQTATSHTSHGQTEEAPVHPLDTQSETLPSPLSLLKLSSMWSTVFNILFQLTLIL